MPTLCKTSISLYTVLFLNERDKVVIEQTRFLSTLFLCSEFKLEYLLWSKFLREIGMGNLLCAIHVSIITIIDVRCVRSFFTFRERKDHQEQTD